MTRGAEQVAAVPQAQSGCPDGGTCHHQCARTCWRVWNCGPLSAAGFPDDRWPEAIRAAHRPQADEPARVEDLLLR